MNERELSAETMRAMQSIRAKADALRQKLCTTVTGDSHAMTWFTANEMLELNASDQSCRELAEAVYSEIDALCSLQSLKEKRRSTVLTNEVLVDVFTCLERDVLDKLGLTSRQFKAIVDKHFSTNCLRKFHIRILNVVHAKDVLPISRLLPKHGSDPSVFRLEVMSQAEDFYTSKKYFYESTNLDELLAKLAEKVPPRAFVQCLDFTGTISIIPTVLEQFGGFGSMSLDTLGITCEDDKKQAMSTGELIDAVSGFASVNALNLYYFELTEVDDDFLKTCRERAILMLQLDAAQAPSVSTNGILDFCFGPTREGREREERDVFELYYFDEALFHRILEAVKTGGKLQHKITLEMKMDYAGPQETLRRFEQLLLEQYKPSNEKGSYVTAVEERATVSWRLDVRRSEEVVLVTCEVEPF